MAREWHICADTGGTFTDVFGTTPDGQLVRTKVLSSSCLRAGIKHVEGRCVRLNAEWDYVDDFFVGWSIRVAGAESATSIVASCGDCLTLADVGSCREGDLLELFTREPAPVLGARMLTQTPGLRPLPPHTMRLATTRGTNALLERKVAPTCFFVTQGFPDLLFIGDQRRPNLFDLDIKKPEPLQRAVIEVAGRLNAEGEEVRSLDLDEAFQYKVRAAREAGCESAAVALLHSYLNPAHERALEKVLREAGFKYIALSSELAPMIKILPRAQTAIADAALGPIMEQYLDSVSESLSGGNLLVMTSAGGLLPRGSYSPKDSLLSGPAGGVVGASATGQRAGSPRVIAFDMGGTSTDVSRCEEDFHYRQQHTVGDATIMAPALPVVTVAAGGGSICGFDGRSLFVGPESAGARPGPACYGAGGPLTLTDVHLLLGRLRPEAFGIPVYRDKAEAALEAVVQASGVAQEELLPGFLRIGNERMAEAIRRVSVREGYDPADYALLSFGGAGGLHACALAELLGMKTVLVPADAGILSAYGLHQAVVERIATRQVLCHLVDTEERLSEIFEELENQAFSALEQEGFEATELVARKRELRLRFSGQESDLSIEWNAKDDITEKFFTRYSKVFGYVPEGRVLEVVSVQVVVSTMPAPLEHEFFPSDGVEVTHHYERIQAFCGESWAGAPVFDRDELEPGDYFVGPAVVADKYSALVLSPGWQATLGSLGTLKLEHAQPMRVGADIADETVRRELFTNRFRGIVEEMGEQLQRTALSTNVKERLDFSCALLDSKGHLIVNAPHIPVHLGAMGLCVRRVVESIDLEPGDVAVTNHPAFGGSHLPDVTVITPVHDDSGELLGYVANRAHHAEIGGVRPGSMPPDAMCLAQEGVVLEPMKLYKAGKPQWEALTKKLSSGDNPSRLVEENLADLRAQVASNLRGADALKELCAKHGKADVQYYMKALTDFAREAALAALSEVVAESRHAEQYLDDGTCIKVALHVENGKAMLDFEGTSPRHAGNLNATPAIVHSAILYVLRLLLKEDLPLNDGLLETVDIRLPDCFLNPVFSKNVELAPAVVAGNVETSQRLVDTLIMLFGLSACSQGTMNNLVFGGQGKSYYETICGGAGAGPGFAGQSCVHTHMTNTAITDPEILERRYPVRLWRFERRWDSGGAGQFLGGDGVVREIEFLSPMSVSLLTQHRVEAPYGMLGGEEGAVGRQYLLSNEVQKILGASATFNAQIGDRLTIETPGGGAWGVA